MISLVGLYGNSRSGKDSVAEILVNDFGYQQRAMAGRIREILLDLDPQVKCDNGDIMCLKELFEQSKQDWNVVKAASKETTDLMIRLGQSCRDVLGKGVWLDSVMPGPCSCKKVKLNNGDIVPGECTCAKIVISDVRQVNEYRAIKERGGVIWKITRPASSEKRGMDGLLDHLDFDAHLHNRGSLVDLRGMVQGTLVSLSNTQAVKGKDYGR